MNYTLYIIITMYIYNHNATVIVHCVDNYDNDDLFMLYYPTSMQFHIVSPQ